MRHLYLLAALLTLALVAPARRPGRHGVNAPPQPQPRPPLPWRPRTIRRVRPYLRAEPPSPPPPEPQPEAALVRPYVLAEEHRREQECAEAKRLGLAALMDLAQAERSPAPAPAPADDMGELAAAVRAYLATTESHFARHSSGPARQLADVGPASRSHPLTDPVVERPILEVAR